MLDEFHRFQNSSKPGSVYATYLLDGSPRSAQEQTASRNLTDGDNTHMQSSPYMNSQVPREKEKENHLQVRRVILASQEDIEDYQNLQTLSECSRATTANDVGEDPLVYAKIYGVIQNPFVKRRTPKQTSTPFLASPAVNISHSLNQIGAAEGNKFPSHHFHQPSSNGTSARSTPRADTEEAGKNPKAKSLSLKREQSDIFKSFSKHKARPAKDDVGDSTSASPALEQDQSHGSASAIDVPMEDSSEAESDDFVKCIKARTGTVKSRSEREEANRRMMEEDDDDDVERAADEPADVDQLEPTDVPVSQKLIPSDSPAVIMRGRRRIRRKVPQKETVKDEEGYLVTREKWVWESASEDEQPPPRKEKTPSSTASSMTRSHTSESKPGQRNIMAFLGKK
ncbi:hypothetical protein ACLMJK_003348 [Lecanora helva]